MDYISKLICIFINDINNDENKKIISMHLLYGGIIKKLKYDICMKHKFGIYYSESQLVSVSISPKITKP